MLISGTSIKTAASKYLDNLTMDMDDMLNFEADTFVPTSSYKDEYEDILTDEENEMKNEVFNPRDALYAVFEKPTTNSRVSQMYTIINLFVIIISTISFLVSTLPENYNLPDLSALEHVVISFFSFDYLVRYFLTRKNRVKWALSAFNMVDLLAIIPYFIELIFEDSAKHLRSLIVLRVVRLLRVFRFVKLARYSRDFPIIFIALKKSYHGFMMSMFAVTLFCIMWSSALFYAEQSYSYLDENSLWRYTSDNSQSPFQSIPHTMWFAMVTMTTVGYGDFTPTSPVGKFVAGLTMITGVIIIALPITILASNFSLEYSKQMVDDKLRDDYKI